MKQVTKPTRNHSENHFVTSGRARQMPALDNLPEQYLTGHWPREQNQPQPACMTDKATQTPAIWTEDGGEANTHKRSASWGSADHLVEISKLRQQLQHSLKGSRSIVEKEEASQTQPKRILTSSSNTALSRPLICRVPSYSECVNQELENVFICDQWRREEETALEVRDGGRAPVPALHQMSCCSPAADTEKDCRPGSPLPEFSSSPKPNNSFMFKREPPEGCEKVKVFEDLMSPGFPIFSCPDRNKVNFIPSGSAFCPVKLLCSSLFPSDASLQKQTSEHCSIRKCLLLS